MFVGWDISTSIIGVSFFREDGSYASSEHLDLRKVEGFMEKCDRASSFVKCKMRDIQGFKPHNFVEDKLSSFAAGKTMLQTLMKLASFNAVISWFLYEETKRVTHIHPSRVKSLVRPDGLIIPKGGDKKAITLDWVSKREPTFKVDLNRNDKPQPWCFDRADSYIVGLAGMKEAACKKSES